MKGLICLNVLLLLILYLQKLVIFVKAFGLNTLKRHVVIYKLLKQVIGLLKLDMFFVLSLKKSHQNNYLFFRELFVANEIDHVGRSVIKKSNQTIIMLVGFWKRFLLQWHC
eukprot:gb/GEZN01008154.1/.p2 GENE.gb/GEZN01008154.1/~~gb/GEZN01008154.1/.p2  ORF type:complete len:111 (+),score=3.77 gb/GEZN01008154.1/:697-1029(+)